MESVNLGLPRPQYVSVPEGFIVALAAQETREEDSASGAGGQAIARAYETARAGTRTKTMQFVATRPDGRQLEKFSEHLEVAGLYVDDDQKSLGEAVASAIAGVQTQAGKVRSAVPMTIHTALLQNMRGLVGAKNPPDTAKIIEKFFAMGNLDNQPGKRAGQYWVQASDFRKSIDPLVFAVDVAVSEALLSRSVSPKEDLPLKVGGADPAFRCTPFTWFHRTWVRLCSTKWVAALPARVWVDWAGAVLRLAFGMGYLWEVAWYEAATKAIFENRPMTAIDLSEKIGPLIPWRDSAAAVSVRDIAASTRWRVMRSQDVRTVITEWTEAHPTITGVATQLAAMSSDGELRRKLEIAVSAGGSNNENLWEAINYTLRTRGGSGESTDHYGLWRKRGPRYSVPDPGVEWMAAVASLSCPGPGGLSHVGQLMTDLRELGLRPELGDLVSRLEQAGVARGSADADQAVQIRSAF